MGSQLAELCRKYGIAELSVFGSVARGDAQPGSDVDLLYVRVPGNDLGMSYFALQEDLEKLFGRPVDLVPKEGLHRVIRDQVLSDAQVLYAGPGRPEPDICLTYTGQARQQPGSYSRAVRDQAGTGPGP